MGHKSNKKKQRILEKQPAHYRKPDEKLDPSKLVPGNRQYRFYDENDKPVWVNEEDLTADDMKELAREYWHYFMYLPADAQEIVIAGIDGMINSAKAKVQEGQILHDMQKASGLHEGPAISEGGIVMPGRTDANPNMKIITGDESKVDPLDFSI